MAFTLYHNPRCSKSRQALALMEEKGIEFKVKEYLKEGLISDEVAGILDKLGGDRPAIIRTKEDLYKENPFALESDEEVIAHLVKKPKLLERPLLVSDEAAIIGRPVEKIAQAL